MLQVRILQPFKAVLLSALLTCAVNHAQAQSDFFASDTTVCAGSFINFTSQTTGALTWYWLFSGGTPSFSSSQNPSGIVYTAPGTYSVILVATDGITTDTVIKTDYITVTTCIPPVADFRASDTAFCERGCINFFDQSTNNPTSWTWQFPGASPVIASNQKNPVGICYPTSGFYDVFLYVRNADGDDSIRKSMYIDVQSCPLPVADFSATPLTACSNECISFTDLTLNIDNTSTWTWYFPGADNEHATGQNPGCVTYSQDGLYDARLIVSNQYGSDTMSYFSLIRIESNPGAFIGPDTTMFFGNTYQLFAGGGVTYQWSPAEGLSATGVPDPVASPTNTTTYTCEITGTDSCKAVRQVTVTILHNNNFFVPTAFSPNGDGRNDYLFLRGTNLQNIRFTVFDRWGEKMFETEDPLVGWDGKYKGKEVNSGVFTWVATMLYNDSNTVTESGTTTLLR